MMDNTTWNTSSSITAMAIPSMTEPECVYRGARRKSELADDSFRGVFWPITGEDLVQKQDEIFHGDSYGNALSSHDLLPLPPTTTSSSDMEILKSFKTLNSTCENSVSGGSQNCSDYSCNRRTEADHRRFSAPKLGMRKCEDSGNPLKKGKPDYPEPTSISFGGEDGDEIDGEAVAHVKEIIYIAAALRPVALGVEEAVERPRRKNLRISSDPQTTAARHRRERISNRLRALQRLVPGGRKMDTASMLDEAASYLKFLKAQVRAFENLGHGGAAVGHIKTGAVHYDHGMLPFPVSFSF